MLVTFTIVTLAWVFFRAESFSKATLYLHQIFTLHAPKPFSMTMFNIGTFSPTSFYLSLFSVTVMMVVERYLKPSLEELDTLPGWDVLLGIFSLTMVICWGVFNQNSFIYFQF